MAVNLDPSVVKLAQFIGLLDPNNQLNSDWLQNPLDELRDAFKDNHAILLELLGDIFESSDGQIQGIPGPNPGDIWYPIPNLDPQILFITTRTYESAGSEHLVFGVGVNWRHTEDDGLTANIWAKIPLVDINTQTGDLTLAFGADDSPVQLAFNIAHTDGFGDASVHFSGIKLASQIYLSKDPELSVQIQQLAIAGKPTANIDISKLIGRGDIDPNQWFDLIFSLLTAKLRDLSPEANKVLDHLFPILGLSGSGPLINWFQLPSLGIVTIKQWALQLLQDENHLTDWLTHWHELMGSGGTLTIEGDGSRIDPKRVALPLSSNLTLWITLAYQQSDQGDIKLYPGTILSSADANFSASDIKLNLQSRLELCCIPLSGPGDFEPLPTFDIGCRLYNPLGDLVSVDFSGAGGDFDLFGDFAVKEMRAGLSLDENAKITPKFELVDVRSAQGNWPTLDLTSGQAIILGLEDMANGIITEQINNLLNSTTDSAHAGKHIAALLGIIPPTSATIPTPWLPELTVSISRLSEFLANPLAAIACYHAECIELQHDSAPLWRFLLDDLQALLHDNDIPTPAITGDGSEITPWQVRLYSGDEGNAYLSIFAENDAITSRPQLDLSLLIEPTKLTLSEGATLQCQLFANLLHLDLPPHSACPGTIHARWLESVAANIKLEGHPKLVASTNIGLTFTLDSVELGCLWLQQTQDNAFSWAANIEKLNATWNLDSSQSITLPQLHFGAGLDLQWNLNTLAADLEIDLDDFSRLIRITLGSWLVERGGGFGFGFAALLGLFPSNRFQWPELAHLPDLNLPDWNNAGTDFPFTLPDDWPTFEVSNWGNFFTNPWPDLVAYFKLLLSKPEWTLTTFNLLGGLFTGKFPDLSLPDWGWGNEAGDGITLPSLQDLPFAVCGGGTYENPWVLKITTPDATPIELLCWLDPDGPPTGDWSSVVVNLLPSEWQDIDALIASADFDHSQIGALLHQFRDLNPHIAQLIGSITTNTHISDEVTDFLGHALNALETRLNLSDGLVPSSSQFAPAGLSNWSQASAPSVGHGEQLSNSSVLTTIQSQINTLADDNQPILLLGSAWESETEWAPLLALFPGISSAHFDLREVGVDPEQINVSHIGSASTRAYIGDIAVFNTAPSLEDAARQIPVTHADSSALSQAAQVARMIEQIATTHSKKVIVVAHSHSGLAALAAAQLENGLAATERKIAGLITIGTPLVGAPLLWSESAGAITDLPADFNLQQGIEEAVSLLSRAGLDTATTLLTDAISGNLPLPEIVGRAFPTHAFEGLADLTLSVPSLAIGTQLPAINLTNTLLGWLKGQIALPTPTEGYTAPTHIGFGVRRSTESTHNHYIVKQQTRFDITRAALTDAAVDTSQYVALPRLSSKLALSKENGWIVGNLSSNPRVRWAEFSLLIDPNGNKPNAILHDAYLDGVALLRTELQQVLIDAPGDTFDLQATLQRLLDAVIKELSKPEINLEAFTCTLDLLTHIDLVTKNDGQYGFNLDGWQALLSDAENYLQNQLQIIITDSTRRRALLNTLNGCFDLDLRAFPFGLLGDGPSIDLPDLAPLQELLAALDLLLPSMERHDFEIPDWVAPLSKEQLFRRISGFDLPLPDWLGSLDNSEIYLLLSHGITPPSIALLDAHGLYPWLSFDFNPRSWITLFTQPKAFIQSTFDQFCANPDAINQLRVAINGHLSLDAVTLPNATLTLSPLCSVSFSHDGIYRFCYSLPNTALAGQISLTACVTIDLVSKEIRGSLHIAPTAFDAGVKIEALCRLNTALEVEYSYTISATFGGQLPESLPYSYNDLQLYPLADISSQLGAMLPRFLLNTTLSTLLEKFVLNSNGGVDQLLLNLELGYRRHPTSPIQLRPIDGLILSPQKWLKSNLVLGSSIEGQCVNSGKVVALINHLADAFALTDDTDVIQLPYGLSLTCRELSGVEFALASATPIVISPGDTLALNLKLTLGNQCQVGVGGDLKLRFSLPDPIDGVDLWDTLGIDIGFNNSQFSNTIYVDALQLKLLPFNGWASLISLSDSGLRLLDTALDALLTELQTDANLSLFIGEIRGLAGTLDLTTPAKIEICLNDPLTWLDTRLNPTNIGDLLDGLNSLLSIPLGGQINRVGNLLTFNQGDLTLRVGRDPSSKLGAWALLSDTELGPITLNFDLGLETANLSTAPTPSLELDLACTSPLITLGGKEINPQLSFALNGATTLNIYPLGDIFTGQQFKLNLLPAISFDCNDACISELLSEILLPLTLELLLDADVTTDFLLTSPPGIRLGSILVDCQLLNRVGDEFNFNFPYSTLTAEQFLYRLTWSALKNLLAIDLFDGAIEIVSKTLSNGDTHYGVRVRLPDATLVQDPEFKLLLGNKSPTWLARTDGPSRENGGIYIYLPTVDEAATDILNSIDLLPEIELVNFGVELTGKNDRPLLDSSGFRLDGAKALLYFSIAFDDGIDIKLGASATIMQIGLPIGGAGGNVIGQNLLSSDAGSGGENSAVNPAFSIELSYFEELDVRLMGREAGETEIWFPIQKTFGPIHIGQIGIKWHDSATKALEILLDGGVSLAGLNVMVDDLGVKIPIHTAGDLTTWSLGLKGLGVSYVGGGVKISGALLRDNDEGTSYSGAVLVEVSGKTFTAIGSYAQDEFTSMFVFVLLPITIGGPPYFFITGLAGGFGYNRGLNVPPVEETSTFPLIEAANGSDKFSNNPLSALRELGSAVPIKRGSYWVAGGIRFSSFELAKSAALAYILLDRGVEVGILGITQMELPEGNPLVNLELALKARFSTRDGVLSVEARLSDNSWLLSQDCRLTGGFAFFVWFDGSNQGDFVITVGGYHHLFNRPSHYPDVPRLGFNWRVSSKITIKGESYFALTPSAVMAGGLLEAAYKSGNLKAWFKAWAHFLIAWKPFAYAIGFGISIGVSYRLRINLLFGSITKTFKLELGAAVEVWGPEFSGIATISWWVISFDVRFGANVGKAKKDAISWEQFRLEFLPTDAKDIIGADVVTGMIVQEKAEDDTEKVTPWILQPEFTFSTATVIATNRVSLFGIKSESRYEVDIRPMHRTDLVSTHHLRLLKNSNGASVITEYVSRNGDHWRFKTNNKGYIDITLKSEKAPAALWDFTGEEERPSADKINTFTGTLIVAEVNENDSSISKTGEIPVKDIIERGIHPLPFFSELSERSGLLGFSEIAELALPDPHNARAIFVAASTLFGPAWAERRDTLLEQLESMGVNTVQQGELRNTPESLSRLHISPPKIASLYEGMAQQARPEPDITTLQPPEIVPVKKWPLRPSLIAILKQRAEPLQAVKKGWPTRVTEVASGQNLPRVKVTRQLAKKVLGARLLRIAAKSAGKRTLPISPHSEFVRSGHSSKEVRDQFRALEEMSLVNRSKEGRAIRNTVAAGATQIWDLPTRNTVGAMPTLSFNGNQGVRVTTLNRGGTLLMEQEFGPGEHLWQPPERTARIAISGLGKPSTPQAKELQAVAMGAFALSESSNGFAAVGWQHDSQLVQLSKLTLLARGAVVKLNAPLELTRKGRVVRQAIVEAASIGHSNETLETLLPNNVDLVCIQVQSPQEQQHSNSTVDIEEALAISSDTLILADKPIAITGPLHSLLVYPVEGIDYGSHKSAKAFASIGTTTSEGWQVTGVFALKGELEPWMRRLTENSLTPIVENGPLSPAGQTTLQFTVDKGEQA